MPVTLTWRLLPSMPAAAVMADVGQGLDDSINQYLTRQRVYCNSATLDQWLPGTAKFEMTVKQFMVVTVLQLTRLHLNSLGCQRDPAAALALPYKQRDRSAQQANYCRHLNRRPCFFARGRRI